MEKSRRCVLLCSEVSPQQWNKISGILGRGVVLLWWQCLKEPKLCHCWLLCDGIVFTAWTHNTRSYGKRSTSVAAFTTTTSTLLAISCPNTRVDSPAPNIQQHARQGLTSKVVPSPQKKLSSGANADEQNRQRDAAAVVADCIRSQWNNHRHFQPDVIGSPSKARRGPHPTIDHQRPAFHSRRSGDDRPISRPDSTHGNHEALLTVLWMRLAQDKQTISCLYRSRKCFTGDVFGGSLTGLGRGKQRNTYIFSWHTGDLTPRTFVCGTCNLELPNKQRRWHHHNNKLRQLLS